MSTGGEGAAQPPMAIDKDGYSNVVEVDSKIEEMFDQADDLMINQ